ncbi:MAG: apolipoprotein N-acyltransferase [Treponema sp.]|nr:apolipoprotein N-acyltransferase [Treponema sp.]
MTKKKSNLNKNIKIDLVSQKLTPQKLHLSLLNHSALILLSSLLFAASFPNPLFKTGLPFFAWFALIPALIVIRKSTLLFCLFWGAIYGFVSYLFFNYWLTNFHPLAGSIVYSIHLVYLAVVFVLLKLALILFPNKGYLVQWLIWLSYEYLRTKGFLGYPYGIIGYSQWQVIPLIQIAGLTGIWGISALVTFPSFWLSSAFNNWSKNLTTEYTEKHGGVGLKLFLPLCNSVSSVVNFFLKERLAAVFWLAVLAVTLIFGFISAKDYSTYPTARIALIQHNTDPWEASRAPVPFLKIEAFRKDLNNLIRLSDEALAAEPKPQLVVWPETAFIPRIYWHTNYREDQDLWAVVKELIDYLEVQDIPFLIGNDDARIEPGLNPDASKKHRVDYNAALLFENGQIANVYRKMHLVPFTEHFPYQKQLPFIFNWLVNANTTFWEKGREKTIFKVKDFSFAAPICFEDSFGYLSRDFTAGGADVLVNLSNDAFAKSSSAQYQHMAMAVFRAVENKRAMVRSTTSGVTCAVDPSGRIIIQAAEFTETWINADVPLIKETTFYTKYGDYLAVFFTFMAVILLLSGAVWCTIKR